MVDVSEVWVLVVDVVVVVDDGDTVGEYEGEVVGVLMLGTTVGIAVGNAVVGLNVGEEVGLLLVGTIVGCEEDGDIEG